MSAAPITQVPKAASRGRGRQNKLIIYFARHRLTPPKRLLPPNTRALRLLLLGNTHIVSPPNFQRSVNKAKTWLLPQSHGISRSSRDTSSPSKNSKPPHPSAGSPLSLNSVLYHGFIPVMVGTMMIN